METIIRLSGDVDPSVRRGLREVQGCFEGINIKALAISASIAAVGIGISKIAIDATKSAIGFETAFAKVNTQLDENIVNLEEYKQDILDASKNTGISAADISESVYQSISAGVNQLDATKFVEQSSKLAVGGFTDTTKAVDITTTALNGYKMAVEEAEAVSDMLITTQNLGKTTVDELASSMGPVIPIAAAANVGFDELSATLATITKNGFSTDIASTYSKSMYGELSKYGSVADKTLRELTGQNFTGLKEAGISTTDILELLSSAAEDNGKSLKDMFGSSEAGSAALVLMSQEGEEYEGILEEIQNSAGATQAAYDTMMSTPEKRMEKLSNMMEVFKIQFGEKLLPVFEKVLGCIETNMPQIEAIIDNAIGGVDNVVANISGGIGFLRDNMGTIIPIVMALTGAIGLYTTALGLAAIANAGGVAAIAASIGAKIVDNVQTAYLGILYAKDAILRGASTAATIAQTIATGAWNVMAGIAATVTTALGAAFTFLASPIGIIIIIIAAVIAAVVLLCKNWDWVMEKAVQLGAFLSATWGNIKMAVGNFISGIQQSFLNGFNSLVNIIKAPINAVISIINGAIGGINGISIAIPDWVPKYGGQTFGANIPTIPLLAKGGFTNGVSIAGEEAMEAVISFDKNVRNENINYWARAGQMLGTLPEGENALGGSSKSNSVNIGNIAFSPKIEITGNADKDDVIKAIEEEFPEFIDLLERWLYERGRFAYVD